MILHQLLGVVLMVVLTEGPLVSPPTESGIASQYGRGVMQRVVAYRQRRGQIPDDLSQYDGFVAVPYAADIGKEYWIRPVGQEDWELFLAVDCGGVKDGGRDWMLRNGVLVEVDWATAVRWNTVGRAAHVEVRTVQK